MEQNQFKISEEIIGKIVYTDKVKMIAVSVDLLNRSVITHLPGDSKIMILDN